MKKLAISALMVLTLTGAAQASECHYEDGIGANYEIINGLCKVGNAFEDAGAAVADVFKFGWVKGIFK